MSSQIPQSKFTCKACGKEIAADDVCRCEICLKKRCPDCVIEIAGKTVCTECKDWALGKLEAGQSLKPDEGFFPSADEIREKRRKAAAERARESGKPEAVDSVRDKVLFRSDDPFMLFYLGILVIGLICGYLLMANILPYVVIACVAAVLVLLMIMLSRFLRRVIGSKNMRIIQVDEWGFSGTTFTGEQKKIPWDEVTSITMHLPEALKTAGKYINVKAGKKHVTIKDNFPRFHFIAGFVQKTCADKSIGVRFVRF